MQEVGLHLKSIISGVSKGREIQRWLTILTGQDGYHGGT